MSALDQPLTAAPGWDREKVADYGARLILGFLFLLPALVTVRREIGLVVAALLSTYVFGAIWVGVLILVAALLWHDRHALAAWLRRRGRTIRLAPS